jgi:ParB family chromosome partitioning protein
MTVYIERRKLVRLENLRVGDPFNSLFPIDPAVLGRIQQDMQEQGYDVSQPIIVRAEKGMIVDGHTRYHAAKNLGIDDVPRH